MSAFSPDTFTTKALGTRDTARFLPRFTRHKGTPMCLQSPPHCETIPP